MADESIASIVPLHQPKKAKTSAERSRGYRQRKRQKGKPAALLDETPSTESVVPEGFSSADSGFAERPVTPPVTVTVRNVASDQASPARSIFTILLRAAAVTLAAVGIAMNGWFARSLGSSDAAGWLFLCIGVAADLVALVMPSCLHGFGRPPTGPRRWSAGSSGSPPSSSP